MSYTRGRSAAPPTALHSLPRNRNRSGDGGGGRIRTYVGIRRQIYSLLPLTTRPPLRVARSRAPPVSRHGRGPRVIRACPCFVNNGRGRQSLRPDGWPAPVSIRPLRITWCRGGIGPRDREERKDENPSPDVPDQDLHEDPDLEDQRAAEGGPPARCPATSNIGAGTWPGKKHAAAARRPRFRTPPRPEPAAPPGPAAASAARTGSTAATRWPRRSPIRSGAGAGWRFCRDRRRRPPRWSPRRAPSGAGRPTDRGARPRRPRSAVARGGGAPGLGAAGRAARPGRSRRRAARRR